MMIPDDFDLQGHRGARGLAPENTIDGFLTAAGLDVVTLELDTVISADGEVVVSHDPTMSPDICSHPDGRPVTRSESEDLRLFDMTVEQIQQFDCGRRGHPDFPEQTPVPAVKPTLKAALDTIEERYGARFRYNIETKSTPAGDGVLHPPPDEFARRLIEVVRRAGAETRTTIQSFDPRTLQAAREQGWEGRLALLIGRRTDGTLQDHVAHLGFIPDIYSPDYRLVDEALLSAAHERGMEVIPWTVNDRRDMRRLVRLGVDGLITDYPNRFNELARDDPERADSRDGGEHTESEADGTRDA